MICASSLGVCVARWVVFFFGWCLFFATLAVVCCCNIRTAVELCTSGGSIYLLCWYECVCCLARPRRDQASVIISEPFLNIQYWCESNSTTFRAERARAFVVFCALKLACTANFRYVWRRAVAGVFFLSNKPARQPPSGRL